MESSFDIRKSHFVKSLRVHRDMFRSHQYNNISTSTLRLLQNFMITHHCTHEAFYIKLNRNITYQKIYSHNLDDFWCPPLLNFPVNDVIFGYRYNNNADISSNVYGKFLKFKKKTVDSSKKTFFLHFLNRLYAK